MSNDVLKAVLDAIKLGERSADSPLSVSEFEAIHQAVRYSNALAIREMAAEFVERARQNFKEQVEVLATRIP